MVRAQGWVRLLLREPCPVQGIPQDGWVYAARIAATRFESWAGWALGAAVIGAYHPPALRLLVLTALVFALTHAPRALIRPKWVLGYVPDFLLPAAVGLAVMLAR